MPTKTTAKWLNSFPPISDLLGRAKPIDVAIRLIISDTGKIETCTFSKIGGDPRAAESSCASLRRKIRFEPALDKDGKAIRSYYVYRFINPNQ
jgi:hypothetical protein